MRRWLALSRDTTHATVALLVKLTVACQMWIVRICPSASAT